MVTGAAAALIEKITVEAERSFFANHDFTSYEMPIDADIAYLELIFLKQIDPTYSPMKANVMGELGICGVRVVVANAV